MIVCLRHAVMRRADAKGGRARPAGPHTNAHIGKRAETASDSHDDGGWKDGVALCRFSTIAIPSHKNGSL